MLVVGYKYCLCTENEYSTKFKLKSFKFSHSSYRERFDRQVEEMNKLILMILHKKEKEIFDNDEEKQLIKNIPESWMTKALF